MTVKEVDMSESDAAAPEDAAGSEPIESSLPEKPDANTADRQLRLSISLRALLTVAVGATMVGAVAVLAWLFIATQHKLDFVTRQAADNAHAEQVALDYAVNAAEINYQDLDAWKIKLVAGTTPELKEKLTKAGQEMEQILAPLEWNSTARPLVAKVRADTGGVYVVDCFVSVLTKTIQGREPLQSTATYSVTIDSNHDWQISDVGGIGAVVEPK